MMLDLRADATPSIATAATGDARRDDAPTSTTARATRTCRTACPRSTNTCADLDWEPRSAMDEALKRIFDAYRGQVADARRARRLGPHGVRMLLASRSTSTRCAARARACPTSSTLLRKHGADATFLFSLGPDHTGRAIKRVFRPGFFGKVRRTSVVRHYGVKTLLYGTRAARTGHRTARRRRDARDRATTGSKRASIRWDHIRWQDGVARRRRRMDARARCSGRATATPTSSGPPARARRGRLADERARAAAHAAAGLRILLRRPRRASASAGVERRADPLPAAADHAADARRADRTRRHHRNQRRRASSRTDEAAPPPATSTRCTPSSRACVSHRSSSSSSQAGRRRAGGSCPCEPCSRRCNRSRCRAAKSVPASSTAAPARCWCSATDSWPTSILDRLGVPASAKRASGESLTIARG